MSPHYDAHIQSSRMKRISITPSGCATTTEIVQAMNGGGAKSSNFSLAEFWDPHLSKIFMAQFQVLTLMPSRWRGSLAKH